jgi:DNA-binding beta-propeller fold protein YncE
MKASSLAFCLCLVEMSLAAGCANRALQTSAPAKQAPANGGSSTEIESWARPKPGWLYVLDRQPQPGEHAGRIWLVDPENSKVMGSIRTGENPDFALSPDGGRLYVATDSAGGAGDLATIDTIQGAVVHREAIQNRVVAKGTPSFSSMAVSGDGQVLRMQINSLGLAETDGYELASFDARTGSMLPGRVHLGNCGYGHFVSFPSADEFVYWCPMTNRIRLIRVDAQSRALQNLDVELPWERRFGVASAFPAPGGRLTTIVRGDGAIFEMDDATQQMTPTEVQGGNSLQGRIPPANWPTSPDGSKVYIGYRRNPDNRFYLDYGRDSSVRYDSATADEFHMFDTRTWRGLGTIRTTMPFWSATVASDGKSLYALAPRQHSILVIDARTVQQTRSIDVGGMPALAIAAP